MELFTLKHHVNIIIWMMETSTRSPCAFLLELNIKKKKQENKKNKIMNNNSVYSAWLKNKKHNNKNRSRGRHFRYHLNIDLNNRIIEAQSIMLSPQSQKSNQLVYYCIINTKKKRKLILQLHNIMQSNYVCFFLPLNVINKQPPKNKKAASEMALLLLFEPLNKRQFFMRESSC